MRQMKHYYTVATIGLWLASCECNWNSQPPAEFPEDSVVTEIAESMCQSFIDCECDLYTAGQETDRSCEESAAALAQTWMEAAWGADLVYDGVCVTVLLDRTCGSTVECQIYSGTADAGEPCTAVGRLMSTCSRPSRCGVDGRCYISATDLPRTGQEGDRCGALLGDYNTPCAGGLACLDGHCVVAADLGAGCDLGTPCGGGGWCSEGTCLTTLAPGQACDTSEACTSKICDEGQCAPEQPAECVGFSW